MERLHTATIHRSGTRSNLFLGGDRELVMFSGLISFVMIFNVQTIQAAVFGIGFWFLILFLLRALAKADPIMRHVYLRHRQYRGYYPARSTPFRENTREYL